MALPSTELLNATRQSPWPGLILKLHWTSLATKMDVCVGASVNGAGGCRALRVPQEVGEVLREDGEREELKRV